MENAPLGVDVDEVHRRMAQSPGVRSVHDLHVWTITTGLNALSAHVVIEDGRGHAELLAVGEGSWDLTGHRIFSYRSHASYRPHSTHVMFKTCPKGISCRGSHARMRSANNSL
jgi:hypothetical protein